MRFVNCRQIFPLAMRTAVPQKVDEAIVKYPVDRLFSEHAIVTAAKLDNGEIVFGGGFTGAQPFSDIIYCEA